MAKGGISAFCFHSGYAVMLLIESFCTDDDFVPKPNGYRVEIKSFQLLSFCLFGVDISLIGRKERLISCGDQR